MICLQDNFYEHTVSICPNIFQAREGCHVTPLSSDVALASQIQFTEFLQSFSPQSS